MAGTKPGTEVEKVEDAEVVETSVSRGEVVSYLPASKAWDEVESFDRIEGFDLEKNKMELVGVPFVVTRVVFREGAYKQQGELMPSDYVSIECVTPPSNKWEELLPRILKTRKAQADEGVPETTSVGPDESLVVNDGSTGIYRQIVCYLHTHSLITVDENVPRDYMNLAGTMGKNPYDAFVAGWIKGAEKARDGIEIRLLCKRGLRASRYENEFTPEGITYYLG